MAEKQRRVVVHFSIDEKKLLREKS